MLATIIKNTILFSIIVVIVHLLLRNRIEDARRVQSRKEKRETLQALQSIQATPMTAAGSIVASPVSATADDAARLLNIAKVDEDVIKRKQMQQLKDLYDFVYAEDAGEELGAYFQNKIQSQCVMKDDKTVRCATGELSADKTLCRNPIDLHLETKKKTPTGHILTANQFKESKEVVLYENEPVETGGFMEGGLQGFESYDLQYVTL